MSEAQYRVLVVDDSAPVVELVQEYLEAKGFEVQGASSGAEALDALRVGDFDVLVADVVMPEMSGYEMVARLREEGVDIPVLMLTGRREVDDVVHGLEMGADDYLTKPFHMAELEARVRALIRRKEAAPGAPINLGDLTLRPVDRVAIRAGRELDLTHREFDILLHFAQRCPRVVTRDELLQKVWGVDFDPGTNVVEVHIFNLRRKLEEGGLSRLIHTERGKGYRMEILEDVATA